MSVGFGFSAGDFIAALNLVGTVIDALRESGRSGSGYRGLIGELYSLESALLRVKRLELEDSQCAEAVALRQAASQCQGTIDDFWTDIRNYQPHLGQRGSGLNAKDCWMKIQWAVCKKKDLAEFRAKLRGHTGSIELLLMTVQMESTNLQGKKQDQQHQTLAGRIQAATFQTMGRFKAIQDALLCGFEQGKELLQATASIMRTNTLVFQMVLNLQNIITRLPGQIERQPPVYFIDALGKHAPFHLEFVRSAEALVAVLRLNFIKVKNGPEKIDRGEFVIEEASSKRRIDLTSDWDLCFLPGQKALMSMVFRRSRRPCSACPNCSTDCHGPQGQERECPSCGVTFHNIYETGENIEMAPFISRTQDHSSAVADVLEAPTLGPNPLKRKVGPEVEDDEMGPFRRVQIRTSAAILEESAATENVEANAVEEPLSSSDLRMSPIDWIGFDPDYATYDSQPPSYANSHSPIDWVIFDPNNATLDTAYSQPPSYANSHQDNVQHQETQPPHQSKHPEPPLAKSENMRIYRNVSRAGWIYAPFVVMCYVRLATFNIDEEQSGKLEYNQLGTAVFCIPLPPPLHDNTLDLDCRLSKFKLSTRIEGRLNILRMSPRCAQLDGAHQRKLAAPFGTQLNALPEPNNGLESRGGKAWTQLKLFCSRTVRSALDPFSRRFQRAKGSFEHDASLRLGSVVGVDEEIGAETWRDAVAPDLEGRRDRGKRKEKTGERYWPREEMDRYSQRQRQSSTGEIDDAPIGVDVESTR